MTNTHNAATYTIEDPSGETCRVATFAEAEALALTWVGSGNNPDVLWIVPGDGSAPTKVVSP